MRSNEIELYKRSLKLSNRQRSIIIGTLLGDGHLETQNDGKTYRLKIEHSIKQSTYVDWFYREFQDWVLTQPKAKRKYLNGTELENYFFQTISVGQFRFYAKEFYKDKRKYIPSKIGRWLTPLAMAVWFMDDGSSKSKHHRAVILNTHCFKRSDIGLLQSALLKNYGIESSLRKQKEGLQILIVGKYAEQFYEIVRPYVLPDFNYKFGALVNTLPKEYRRRSKVG
jgi:hypothetical protein